jgi:hypothetical protein
MSRRACLQFTSECQRFWPHRASISGRSEQMGGEWRRAEELPAGRATAAAVIDSCVYNFVLEHSHVLLVDGVECATWVRCARSTARPARPWPLRPHPNAFSPRSPPRPLCAAGGPSDTRSADMTMAAIGQRAQGHGMQGPVVGHSFYGSAPAVRRALAGCRGWER